MFGEQIKLRPAPNAQIWRALNVLTEVIKRMAATAIFVKAMWLQQPYVNH